MQDPAPTTPETLEVSDPARLPAEPVVSVVMLAYAHEATLAEAIEGVLAQRTDYPYELLIGEDCSLDRTREIALDYQRRYPDRIRVLFSTTNIGAFANSRRTIEAAKGRFIAFCEGDDYWIHPEKVQMQATILSSKDRISMVHSDFDRVVGGRSLKSFRRASRQPAVEGESAFGTLLLRNSVGTATTMYRADVLRTLAKSGICSPEWPFGDYPKALFAALQGEVAYLPMSTAAYRWHPTSATRGRQSRLRMAYAAMECRQLFLFLAGAPYDLARRIRISSLEQILEAALLLGDSSHYESCTRLLEGEGIRLNKPKKMIARFVLRFAPLLKAMRASRRMRERALWFLRSEPLRSEKC